MGEYYEYNKLPVIRYAGNHNSQEIRKVSKQTDDFYEFTSKTRLHCVPTVLPHAGATAVELLEFVTAL
jgi:hypothetical protein